MRGVSLSPRGGRNLLFLSAGKPSLSPLMLEINQPLFFEVFTFFLFSLLFGEGVLSPCPFSLPSFSPLSFVLLGKHLSKIDKPPPCFALPYYASQMLLPF